MFYVVSDNDSFLKRRDGCKICGSSGESKLLLSLLLFSLLSFPFNLIMFLVHQWKMTMFSWKYIICSLYRYSVVVVHVVVVEVVTAAEEIVALVIFYAARSRRTNRFVEARLKILVEIVVVLVCFFV